MKIQDTVKQYISFYGLPKNQNPFYIKIKKTYSQKQRKVEPVHKSKTIDIII